MQLITQNIYKSTAQWEQSSYYLEMVCIVSGYMAKFTIWSHQNIQMRKISWDNSFIFSILLKQQNILKTN
jgi:hypothetical protein